MLADEPVDVRLVPAAAVVWLVAVGAVALPASLLLVGALLLVVGASLVAGLTLVLGPSPTRAGRIGRIGRVGRRAGRARRADGVGRAAETGCRGGAGQTVLVLGCVAVLLLATGSQVRGRDAGDLRALAEAGRTARVRGVVRSTPVPVGGVAAGDGPVRFLVAARAVQPLGPAGPELPTRAAVEVLAPPAAGGLVYGTEVEVVARLAPARDRAARAVAWARASEVPRVRAPPSALLRATEALRSGLVGTAREVPGDAGRLLPAVAVGDTRGVGDLDQAMRDSGLAHLTAVSGAHFSLLGGVVLALTARCRVPRRWRWLPVAVVMAGFVAVVHPGASVVRAAAMGAVGVLGLVAGRPARTVPALAGAVLVLLVVDPWLARDLGFVLSVVATAGIALLAVPLARAWNARPSPDPDCLPDPDCSPDPDPSPDSDPSPEPDRSPLPEVGPLRTPGGDEPPPVRASAQPRAASPRAAPRPPPAFATALAVPVAAQAVCAPVVLLLSPTVPTYAVLANLVVAPAVAPATIAGLLAALLGPWWPAAATWCAQVAGAGCWWIAAVARTVSGLPGGQISWVGGPAGPVLLASACAAALVLVLRRRWAVAP
jgi:competence protein ComEC